jgi:spore germination protein GerM
MEEQDKNPSLSPKLIASVVILLLTAGSVTAWWANNSLKSTHTTNNLLTEQETPSTLEQTQPEQTQPEQTQPEQTQPEQTQPEQTQSTSQQEKVEVYWLDDNLELIASTVTIQKANQKSTPLENAFQVLLAGSTDNKGDTAIPEGTKLLSLKTAKDGVHVNLSQEFTSGGGSASMIGRLGQVIYTASSIDPNTPVWISIEGNPLEELGGEGLLVEQPMTRQSFMESF